VPSLYAERHACASGTSSLGRGPGLTPPGLSALGLIWESCGLIMQPQVFRLGDPLTWRDGPGLRGGPTRALSISRTGAPCATPWSVAGYVEPNYGLTNVRRPPAARRILA